MKYVQYILIMSLSSLFLFTSCTDDGKINIFTVQDDIELGQQLRDEVLSSPDYNIMSRSQNREAYNYLEGIVQDILNSGEVNHVDDFDWEIHLVKDDSTLNAFAAPGGYIFVYTGIIKYLDSKDAFVGVMGHEMGHADKRHSTTQLTKQYGVATLLDVLLGGDDSLVKDILGSLVSLKFSRSDETEADKQSVIYLCNSEYAANGVAMFFEKMEAAGAAEPPEFLSTHPSHAHRIEDIYEEVEERNCNTIESDSAQEWQHFQSIL